MAERVQEQDNSPGEYKIMNKCIHFIHVASFGLAKGRAKVHNHHCQIKEIPFI
jgi:hypothetical protein